MMVKRLLLFAVACLLFRTISGCGGGGAGRLSDLDERLSGKWASETPNAQGDVIFLVFEPTEGDRRITIQSVRPLGDALTVDTGSYQVAGARIQFNLPQLGNLDLPFAVESVGETDKLTLGEEVYFKTSPGAATLSGQVRIVRLSADELVTVSSVEEESRQWNLQFLNMEAVFEDDATLDPGGEPVYVAVVDTGILFNHPALTDKIARRPDNSYWGYDFVTDYIDYNGDGTETSDEDFDLDGTDRGPDDNPTDPGDLRSDMEIPGTDSSWHGTHIAALIAADPDDRLGVAGLNRHVKIIPIRAVGRNGNGFPEDVAQGIRYACRLPNSADCDPDADGNPISSACYDFGGRPLADIVNLSLGVAMTAEQARPLQDAIDGCYAQGVLVVAAAGNDHLGPGYCWDQDLQRFVADAACRFYPASGASVASVGAVTGSGAFAKSYSNYGNRQRFVAPGGSGDQGVLSAVNPGTGDEGYWDLIGTSQAAAHLSGLASLIKYYRPDITPADLVDLFQQTAIYLGETPPWDERFGYGLINPRGALYQALGQSPSGPPKLAVSVDGLDFGSQGENQKATVILYNAGGGSLDLLSADPVTEDGGPWLQVEWKQIDEPSAPWALVISVDRQDLEDGDYHGKVVVQTSGGDKDVEVALKVSSLDLGEADEIDNLIERTTRFLNGTSEFENTVDIGEVTILAIPVDNPEAKPRKLITNFAANYNFYLTLPPGKWQIVGGVNDNNDSELCGPGDSVCLGYPTNDNLQTINCTTTCDPATIVLND